MDIKGSQKIHAPRERVFQALLNPEVLKNSVPGCEGAEFEDTPQGRQLRLIISPSIPGLKGPYRVYLQARDVVAPSHVVLVAEPTSSIGSVKATCAIDLADEGANTDLTYAAHADMDGKIAATPEFVVKPAVKSALDHFFKNFEKQVSAPVA
jgi:carbon monoxide dehydrogenase subunit G